MLIIVLSSVEGSDGEAEESDEAEDMDEEDVRIRTGLLGAEGD